jgi:hypothetical protein
MGLHHLNIIVQVDIRIKQHQGTMTGIFMILIKGWTLWQLNSKFLQPSLQSLSLLIQLQSPIFQFTSLRLIVRHLGFDCTIHFIIKQFKHRVMIVNDFTVCMQFDFYVFKHLNLFDILLTELIDIGHSLYNMLSTTADFLDD